MFCFCTLGNFFTLVATFFEGSTKAGKPLRLLKVYVYTPIFETHNVTSQTISVANLFLMRLPSSKRSLLMFLASLDRKLSVSVLVDSDPAKSTRFSFLQVRRKTLAWAPRYLRNGRAHTDDKKWTEKHRHGRWRRR